MEISNVYVPLFVSSETGLLPLRAWTLWDSEKSLGNLEGLLKITSYHRYGAPDSSVQRKNTNVNLNDNDWNRVP